MQTMSIATAGYERHVVLVAPEVHWNTGNIGRTCLGAGAWLHLIKPLGFSLDDRNVKRAGLDYWPKVKLSVWNGFDDFLDQLEPKASEIALFAKKGPKPLWDMPASNRRFLVFGSETKGLPDAYPHYTGNSMFEPVYGSRYRIV